MPSLSATPQNSQAAAEVQRVEKRFGPCIGGERHTCVVDGDTIWLNDVKIRIADIDAPEVFDPDCEAERIAGQRATERLTVWLNAGAFEVHPNPDGRDADRYGRKLRVLARGGSSAVDALVAEGVAARWGGAGKAWC
nr:thermonuclease family protein [Citromicrobium sp. JLT1363]